MFLLAAQKNHARSQFYMALFFENAFGVIKDSTQALIWYKKSADNGCGDAQIVISDRYRLGIDGTTKNYAEALVWSRKFADSANSVNYKDDGYLEFHSGCMYQEGGYGLEKDSTRAFQFYARSLSLGFDLAVYKLGLMYYHGAGVKKNYKKALKWFLKAAEETELSNVKLMHYIAEIYENGIGGIENTKNASIWYAKICNLDLEKSHKTPFEIATMYYHRFEATPTDYRIALYWFEKSLNTDDNSKARYYIGMIYMEGKGDIEKDYTLALRWLEEAVIHGHTNAPYCIGLIYFNGGNGIEKNYKRALKWFLESHEDKDKAIPLIDTIYRVGECGVEKDIEKLETFLMQNTELVGVESLYNLGISRTVQTNYEQNFNTGFLLFKHAAEKNHPKSQFYVGLFYEKGLGGIEKNYIESIKWYSKSADNGCSIAMTRIGWLYYKGFGFPQDYGKSLSIYQKAISTNDCVAAYRFALNGMGLLYQDGVVVKQSLDLALSYFLKATKLNSPDAFSNMGDAYNYGYGVNIDYDEAMRWYLKSAKISKTYNTELFSEGLLNIGIIHLGESGGIVDIKLAISYLEEASKWGNDKAENYINQILNNNISSRSTHSPSLVEVNVLEPSSPREEVYISDRLREAEDRLAQAMAELEELRKINATQPQNKAQIDSGISNLVAFTEKEGDLIRNNDARITDNIRLPGLVDSNFIQTDDTNVDDTDKNPVLIQDNNTNTTADTEKRKPIRRFFHVEDINSQKPVLIRNFLHVENVLV